MPLKKVVNWLKKVLLWNFCIRIFMEAAIEISICTVLNLRFGTFRNVPWGAFVNHLYAYFFAGAFILFPFFVVIHYCYNFGKLEDEEFKKVWGDLYEGLDAKRRVTLLYPIIFVGKRLIFNFLVFNLNSRPHFQLICMLETSLFIAIYLLHFRPFESGLINNLEIFNETCTVMILIQMLIITDAFQTGQDTDVSVKIFGGRLFIGMLGLIIVV